jgi:hypothetical protein
MKRYLFLIVVVCLTMVAADSKADPGKDDAASKDLVKIQGKWQLVESET